jgi:hypothetical protein
MKGLLEPNRVTEVAVGTLCAANLGATPAGWVFLDGTTQQQTWLILDTGKFPWVPNATMQLSKPEDDAASGALWGRVTTAAEFRDAYVKYIAFHYQSSPVPPGAVVFANQEILDGVPTQLPDPPKLPPAPAGLPSTTPPWGASAPTHALHISSGTVTSSLTLHQVEVGPIGGVCQGGRLVGAVMSSRYPVSAGVAGAASSFVECWVLGADYRSPLEAPVTIGKLNVTDYPSLSKFAQIMSNSSKDASTTLTSWTKPA